VKNYVPKQGDIIFGNFSPTVGKEKTGKRPALVVSIDLLSKTSSFVLVAPITTGKYDYPTHVSLDDRTKTKGVIHVEQLRCFDYTGREIIKIETCPMDIRLKVHECIATLTNVI